MYKKLKQILLRIPYFNWVTLSPLFLAFILPNILQPEWAWRLGLIFLCSLGLMLFVLRVILIPELMEKDLSKVNGTIKRVMFYIGYFGCIAGALASSIFVYKSALDIVSFRNLETKQVQVDKTRTGGVTALAGQGVTFEGESHTLAFHWGIIRPGQEYTITYSPTTNFIYEIHPY